MLYALIESRVPALNKAGLSGAEWYNSCNKRVGLYVDSTFLLGSKAGTDALLREEG